MNLKRLADLHPFLWLAGLAIFAMTVGRLVRLDYDDSGAGTVWFVSTYSLTWPFRLASDTASRLNGGADIPAHGLVTVAGGLVIYVLLDVVLTRIAKVRARGAAAAGPV